MPNQTNPVSLKIASTLPTLSTAQSASERRKAHKLLEARAARLTKVRDLLDEDIAATWQELRQQGIVNRVAHDAVASRLARVTKLRDRTDAEFEIAWAALAVGPDVQKA